MKKQNNFKTNENKKLKLTQDKKQFNAIIEEILDHEAIIKIIEENYSKKTEEQMDNIDVNINHLENIFTVEKMHFINNEHELFFITQVKYFLVHMHHTSMKASKFAIQNIQEKQQIQKIIILKILKKGKW